MNDKLGFRDLVGFEGKKRKIKFRRHFRVKTSSTGNQTETDNVLGKTEQRQQLLLFWGRGVPGGESGDGDGRQELQPSKEHKSVPCIWPLLDTKITDTSWCIS